VHDILLVEDNPDARETLRLLLELEGHRVEPADSGGRGIELAANGNFSVALIDIGLPDVDGYQVAREIRSKPSGKRLVLIALTGYGQPDDRRRALEAGFDAHLVKPIDPDTLTKALSHFASPAA
jgi:CheY-like chemotaxis protein